MPRHQDAGRDCRGSTVVSEFVMISTDKAVNPTSVMGASKRAAEIVVQSDVADVPRHVSSRVGRLRQRAWLGRGVVPIFKEQIARGGPVTVTHPEMKRYFMTIPEACQLVLQAGAMGLGAEIFVLRHGRPGPRSSTPLPLATSIALSGLREGEDIEIAFPSVSGRARSSTRSCRSEEECRADAAPRCTSGK